MLSKFQWENTYGFYYGQLGLHRWSFANITIPVSIWVWCLQGNVCWLSVISSSNTSSWSEGIQFFLGDVNFFGSLWFLFRFCRFPGDQSILTLNFKISVNVGECDGGKQIAQLRFLDIRRLKTSRISEIKPECIFNS